jgi:hypothetical protein
VAQELQAKVTMVVTKVLAVAVQAVAVLAVQVHLQAVA